MILRQRINTVLICLFILMTGCTKVSVNMGTDNITNKSTAMPTNKVLIENVIQVADFSSLKATCKSDEDVVIKLADDVVVTKTLKFDTKRKAREVIIDLDGHTLFFEDGKTLNVEEKLIFTLTDGQTGGSVNFMYNPQNGIPGCIQNSAKFILDGGVTVTAQNKAVNGMKTKDDNRGTVLIFNGYDSSFIMNSGTLNAKDSYNRVIDSLAGNVFINDGSIHVEGKDAVAVNNWGGKFNMTGGEINISGKRCIAVENEDAFEPCGTPALVNAQENNTPRTVDSLRDTFVMSGGAISATGKNAIAVTIEKNCTIIDGSISVVGENSVGIKYFYIGGVDNQEKANIKITGGHINAESSALIDERGNIASYRNAAGETVYVDSSIKYI